MCAYLMLFYAYVLDYKRIAHVRIPNYTICIGRTRLHCTLSFLTKFLLNEKYEKGIILATLKFLPLFFYVEPTEWTWLAEASSLEQHAIESHRPSKKAIRIVSCDFLFWNENVLSSLFPHFRALIYTHVRRTSYDIERIVTPVRAEFVPLHNS